MKVGCTSDSVDSGWQAALDKHRILDSRFNGYTQRGSTSQSVEHGDGVCVSERCTHMPGLCTFSGWGIDTDALQAASLQDFTQCPGSVFECDGSSNVRELHHCNQRAAARRGELEHVEGRRASRIDTLEGRRCRQVKCKIRIVRNVDGKALADKLRLGQGVGEVGGQDLREISHALLAVISVDGWRSPTSYERGNSNVRKCTHGSRGVACHKLGQVAASQMGCQQAVCIQMRSVILDSHRVCKPERERICRVDG